MLHIVVRHARRETLPDPAEVEEQEHRCSFLTHLEAFIERL